MTDVARQRDVLDEDRLAVDVTSDEVSRRAVAHPHEVEFGPSGGVVAVRVAGRADLSASVLPPPVNVSS